jgi:hypothetical protein
MRRLKVAALVVMLAAPADAARCPYGQILRVSMGRCVSVHSRLALGYVHRARARRIAVALPTAKPAPIEPPEIEVLRERLAHRVASLEPIDILLSRAAALAP